MTLHEFNLLPKDQLSAYLKHCCGSESWVQRMLQFVPADDMVELLEDAEEQWWLCNENDWKEAFAHHPKIGEKKSPENKSDKSAEWAAAEQKGIEQSGNDVLNELKQLNIDYEKRFGYVFITCATGKSAKEMLAELHSRLQNSPEVEIEIAADEQNKITKLRIEKLLE